MLILACQIVKRSSTVSDQIHLFPNSLLRTGDRLIGRLLVPVKAALACLGKGITSFFPNLRKRHYLQSLTLVLTLGHIDQFSICVLYQKIWDVEISAENV